MTTLEVLRAGRQRLANPEDWFQVGGVGDGPYCAALAIEGDDVMDALWALARAMGCARDATCPHGTIWDFNDTHTHAEVLAALYKAAELSEQG